MDEGRARGLHCLPNNGEHLYSFSLSHRLLLSHESSQRTNLKMCDVKQHVAQIYKWICLRHNAFVCMGSYRDPSWLTKITRQHFWMLWKVLYYRYHGYLSLVYMISTQIEKKNGGNKIRSFKYRIAHCPFIIQYKLNYKRLSNHSWLDVNDILITWYMNKVRYDTISCIHFLKL